METKIGIQGRVKAVITRADGTESLISSAPNTISNELKNKIAASYIGVGNYWGCLISAFTDDSVVQLTSSHNNQSGILLTKSGPTYYMMDSDAGTVTGTPTTAFAVVGVIRNNTGSTHVFDGARIGYDWENSDSDFAVRFADAAGWSDATIEDGEMLTVTWTISIS